jgi:hypothetical protein
MSLLQLLTAGNSLVGGKDHAGRYHEKHPRSIPKFGGKKNPFRATARPEGEEKAEVRNPKSEVQGLRSEAGRPTRLRFATARQESEVLGRKGIGWAGVWAGVAEWMGRVGSGVWKRWPGRKTVQAAKPAPEFTKSLLQTELSLDKVKVVRNDLSDSDLEVVPAGRQESRPPAANGARVAGTNGSAARVWGRMAGRVLGTGKS